jgi:hypothetical protein
MGQRFAAAPMAYANCKDKESMSNGVELLRWQAVRRAHLQVID